MADQDISVFTLGEGGVDVDNDPILTADNVYLNAQNATVDPTQSRAGALVKRMGLDRFNTAVLPGPVLGGIEAPFAGTAGAPNSGGGGGGFPGEGGGTNDSQPLPPTGGYGVGPGSNLTTGSGIATGSSGGGASSFASAAGQTTLFGGQKIIVIGRSDNGTTGASGAGWYLTTKGLNAIALLTTGPGPPMNGFTLARLVGGQQSSSVGQTANHDQITGFPTSVTEGLGARPNGVLFYPQRTDPTEATGTATGALPALFNPVIRRNDGKSDQAVATIPVNPTWAKTGAQYSTGHGMAIVGMATKYGDGGHIYIAVHDRLGAGGVTIANDGGRLFVLDTASFALTERFTTNPAGTGSNYNQSPGTLSPLLSGGGVEAWFGSVLESQTGTGQINALVPTPGLSDGYANWIGYESTYAVKSDVTCMAIYQGALFVGHMNTAATPAYAVINANPLNSGLALSLLQLTASGGAISANNHFASMAIFQGKLYVSYFNTGQIAKIYSFDGTTWATVYTSGTNSNDLVPFNLQVDSDGDILYAFGCVDSVPPACWLTSVDGTTWVSKSANLTGNLTASGGGDFSHSFPMNIFADFKQ